ncbi:MAG: nitroreductase family protein, partial [Lachnospiraceae bacterium]|nr:nitroreductase family protein [Lachnospiraceae bacterium]
YTTGRGDTWQMYDAGVASEAFCLAAYEQGLGTVIMGIFDQEAITSLLELPEDRELVALIAIGHPAEEPVAPKRKTVEDLLSYM